MKTGPPKNLPRNLHSSVTHKSQAVETTPRPVRGEWVNNGSITGTDLDLKRNELVIGADT